MMKRTLLALTVFVSFGSSCAPARVAGEPAQPSAAPADSSAAPADSSAAPATAASSSAAAAPAAPAAIDWHAMTHEQRLEHMKTVVMPRMRTLFTEFDAQSYAKMKCPTCHGDGALPGGNFKMPNPKLPKLSYSDGFKKHLEQKPEITRFMMERVVPEMAALLGEQPYDPATQKGFGCGECHEMGP